MNFQSDIIRGDEKAVFSLRSLYSSFGFKQFRMSKFEEYDLYVKNKDFLVSNEVITLSFSPFIPKSLAIALAVIL